MSRTDDTFTAQYGVISSTANRRAFAQDNSYCLLSSLEILDEDGNLERKADIFTKRTIRRAEPVTSVDTASEALALSIGEKARVNVKEEAERLARQCKQEKERRERRKAKKIADASGDMIRHKVCPQCGSAFV